eukprot:4377008-Prorocentrum_lima.AAC.1
MMPIRMGGLGLASLLQQAPAVQTVAWAIYATTYKHEHAITRNPEFEHYYPHANASVQTA